MAEMSNGDKFQSENTFNVLSFERKLVELVEEVRLRRNLEIESENTLKSVMDEKYDAELCWEEQQRGHIREKDDLEQQIELLKRKLEDKVCVSDDDKAKQQIINKTYSQEIRMLKENLRNSTSEKLNLQKKIQELEGKLSLHNQFQEDLLGQVSEVRNAAKSIVEESQRLATIQKNVLENVSSAKLSFRKFDLCNQHLTHCMTLAGKKSGALQKELVKCRSELTILKNTAPKTQEKKNSEEDVDKLRKKILELENLFLMSRKENEKTLNNFVQSNEMLCKFIDKYAENWEREKQLLSETDAVQDKLIETEKKLQEMQEKEELIALQKKMKIDNQVSVGVQTEIIPFGDNRAVCLSNSTLYQNTSGMDSTIPSSTDGLVGNVPAETRRSNHLLMLDGQQDSFLKQTMESCEIGNFQAFCMNAQSLLSGDKRITISEVLKRKIELTCEESVRLVSTKKRLIGNGFPLEGNGSKDVDDSRMISACSTDMAGEDEDNLRMNSARSMDLPVAVEDEENLRMISACGMDLPDVDEENLSVIGQELIPGEKEEYSSVRVYQKNVEA